MSPIAGQLTVDRRLMTLAALRLLDRPASVSDVLRVLKAVHADGLWPQVVGRNTYYVNHAPYSNGVSQHLDQMRRFDWVEREDDRLWVVGTVCPTPPPLPARLPDRYLATFAPEREIPDPLWEDKAAKKVCPVCRRRFKSEAWTCGDPVCAELVVPPAELLARLSGLQSDALDVLLDVDIRTGQRFVLVQTGRGEWRVNCTKYELWEHTVERALS